MIEILFPIFVGLGITISSGVFITTIVKDKEEKLRYLMHFAGMRPAAYYIGTCFADLTLFSIPIGLLMLMSYLMSIEAFYKKGGKMFLMLMLFGFPFISLIYLSSFLFSS